MPILSDCLSVLNVNLIYVSRKLIKDMANTRMRKKLRKLKKVDQSKNDAQRTQKHSLSYSV